MNDYYQVHEDWKGSGGWRLYRGDDKTVVQVDGEVNGKVYQSVAATKVDCYRRFGEIPIRVYADELAFDPGNMVHAALAELESRHSDASVVAVGSQHYLIRRSKFGVEVRVGYACTDTGVKARNDSEHFAPKKMTPAC
jgi:hypothetical protein